MAVGEAPKTTMSLDYVLSFATGAMVDKPSADRVVIQVPLTSRKCAFDRLSPGLRQVIDVLSSTGATEDELARLVEEVDGVSALARFYYYLSAFAERRVLSYSVPCGNRRLATLSPASPLFSFSRAAIDPHGRYTISRFTYLHREQEHLVLESPLSHGRITLHGWAGAAVAAELAKPCTPAELCDLLQNVPRDAVVLFLEMLVSADFVSELKPDQLYAGESESLAPWDFHDLLFHARSRLGRHANPCGGTYRFYNKIGPLPAVKQLSAAGTIDLHRPDMASLEQKDSAFTVVLERRRSIREYGDKPITDRQLGEFLYRSARVKDLRKMEFQELSRRPYPGAGAIYELEIYVNVHRCQGLLPGLYHFCPNKHRLEMVCGPTEDIAALLKDAARAAGLVAAPQIAITIAARFQRLSWKYESIAYSLLLKNVGALYQTMYLVATAMDLAPCALGGGNSDLFARAAGLDYYAETSVGEFLLGSNRNSSL
jgi:SagB-type dehydrogenase family enzyme